MRQALLVLFSLLLASPAQAQILRLKLRDKGVEKRFQKHLIDFNGEKVLVGEIKSGLKLQDQTWLKEKSIQMWVADAADPSKMPYKFDKKDNKVANGRRTIANLADTEVVDIQFFLRQSSFLALSREYDQRLAQIDALREARNAQKKSSRDWFHAHRRMVNAYERLHQWLQGSVYPVAAAKLVKTIEKEKKTVSKEAYQQRARLAQESIQPARSDDKLDQVAEEVSGGKYTFRAQDSQHIRITYYQGIPDQRVTDLLKLAEVMVDGFRAHCIDPYLDEDYTDTVPDGQFLEYYFGPNDLHVHEHMLEKYYETQWGNHRQARIQATSGRYRRGTAPQYLQYWNSDEHLDLEGIVAHGLGHTLANLQYNQSRRQEAPPWLEEAVAFYLSLEYLGQNSVMCKEFRVTQYAGENPGKEGEKTIFMGERELYNHIARDRGRGIDVLALRTLHQMDDADFAKAWSLYDYVLFREGKAGQLWLREACESFGHSQTYLADWRKKSEELFAVEGKDVFAALDERWAEYAATFQPQGRRKR